MPSKRNQVILLGDHLHLFKISRIVTHLNKLNKIKYYSRHIIPFLLLTVQKPERSLFWRTYSLRVLDVSLMQCGKPKQTPNNKISQFPIYTISPIYQSAFYLQNLKDRNWVFLVVQIGQIKLTGKLIRVPAPQYFKAARSQALAAASSSSYAPEIFFF